MGLTLISNNCCALYMYKDIHHRYDSPTIALQIMPSEFPKFCANLKHYLECEIKPYPVEEMSEYHKNILMDVYYQIHDFPYGLCDDIMVVFQHYTTFEEGKRKWEERKKRVDFEHIGYVFLLLNAKVSDLAYEFDKLDLPNKLIITRNFDVDCATEHYRFDLEPNREDFNWSIKHICKRNYEVSFDKSDYLKRVGE